MLFVCAATTFELASCPEWEFASRDVTGVGAPATFHTLPTLLRAGPVPSLLLNLGIAGAYPGSGITIGDVVVADSEVWGDVGMELPDAPYFLPVAETDFGREFYSTPFPMVVPADLPRVVPGADFQVLEARGCTVNACTGTRAVGERRSRQFGTGFETMEGAAVAQVARDAGVPACEIRAISNIAAEREMRPENIRLALANLRIFLETCGPVFAVFGA